MSEEKTKLENGQSLRDKFGDAGAAIYHLNSYLEQLAELIKEEQPGRPDGAIQLYFEPCGKGCSGCPHPRWGTWFQNRKYWNAPKEKRGVEVPYGLRRKVKDSPRKSRAYQASKNSLENDLLAGRIDQAMEVIEKRKTLLDALRGITISVNAARNLGERLVGEKPSW